jgi:hypothetical protein
MSKAKRQHYVPQFYLRQWAQDGKRLWVYPLDGRTPWPDDPGDYASENHLYTAGALRPGEPLVDVDSEEWFSSWEGRFASVWPDIFDRAAVKRTRMNLIRFIATLVARHPDRRDEVRDMNSHALEDAENVADGEDVIYAHSRTGETIRVAAESIREQAKTDRTSVGKDFIRLMKGTAAAVIDALKDRRWGLLCSTDAPFVTSDRPVILERGLCMKPTFGYATPGTHIVFPVSPSRMLVIADHWESEFAHYEVGDRLPMTRAIIRRAKRFVFADRKDEMIILLIRQELAG